MRKSLDLLPVTELLTNQARIPQLQAITRNPTLRHTAMTSKGAYERQQWRNAQTVVLGKA